jgi:putative oxidoreductase
MVVAGVGFGALLGAPTRYIITREVPANMRATAVGLLSIFLIIGQIFGGSLAGGVFGTSISNPQAYRALYLIFAGIALLARLLMCSLFIWDGVLQLRNPAGTADYFASLDVPMPNIAVWVSIPIHLLAGLAILVGYKTRWAAAVLLLLCLGTAFGVHLPAGDTENMINFYKNLVMAGGFLYVINFGAGVLSFDDGVPAR